MKDLRTLQLEVKAAPSRSEESVPGHAMLLDSDLKIIASTQMAEGGYILVYENGYVLYYNGYRHTVFPLHDIRKGYLYKSSVEEYRPDLYIDKEEILSANWPVGVVMMGEDRVIHSQRNSGSDSYYYTDCYTEGMAAGGVGCFPDRFLSGYEMILYKENLELAFFALSQLNESERSIILDYFYHNKHMTDIARERQITKQSVWESFHKSLSKMRKTMGVPEPDKKK